MLRATYRLAVPPEQGAARAEALRLEQSAELPAEGLPPGFAAERFLPRFESLQRDPDGGVRVTLAFPAATLGPEPGELLNLLLGNCSLQADVTLVAVEPGSEVAAALGGPRFGAAGLRKLRGDREVRPLTCVALKPVGLEPRALAELCGLFARAGIDVIKDDHGLADHAFCPFEERVAACLRAIERATPPGREPPLYAPHVIGTPEAIARQVEKARALGARALLVAPLVVGLPQLAALARRDPAFALLAHPALAGSTAARPEALLGTLFRLYGADAVIFPHAGGRFPYSEATCAALARALRGPLADLRPALPVAAGGIALERVDELLRFYGADVMLLVGASLYRARERLLERSREFVDAVRRAAERLEGEGGGA